MVNINSSIDTASLVALAREAGEAILTIYNADKLLDLQLKEDDSPLTAADLAANQVLLRGLPAIADIPIISEENPLPELSVRRQWPRYWLLDPLDGTKEFIQRNGEFTVNIALIEQGSAVLGVVHVPVSDVTYVGVNPVDGPKRAIKYTAADEPKILQVRALQEAYQQQRAVTSLVSHRHGAEALVGLMNHLQQAWPGPLTSISAGSSLKFCLVAEGSADFYPRLAPTSEWDTAAAQAVLEAAGGAVVEAEAFDQGRWIPLTYNARPQILNPSFYALGDSSFDWLNFLYRKAPNPAKG